MAHMLSEMSTLFLRTLILHEYEQASVMAQDIDNPCAYVRD